MHDVCLILQQVINTLDDTLLPKLTYYYVE